LQRVCNWVSSDAELDEPISADDSYADAAQVSAGNSLLIFKIMY